VKAHAEAVGNRSKLSEYAKATLGSGNMRSAVVLPKGEELNEWLAVNSQTQIMHMLAAETTEFIRRSPSLHVCLIFLLLSAVDFFNEISLLYGTITEFCTSQSCPVMSASAQFEYLWCDNQKVREDMETNLFSLPYPVLTPHVTRVNCNSVLLR
jgi:MOB kinase activator 1